MKVSRILAAVLLVGGVLMISTAAFALPTPTCILVGDVDNYGNIPGASDQGTAVWPGPGPSGSGYDGRSAAEKIATDGAQLTDCYSALYPAFGPNPSEIGQVMIPLPAGMKIHDGTFVMAMGDFQASTFGAIAMNINGVALDSSQPQPSTFDDGFQVTTIRAFVLNHDCRLPPPTSPASLSSPLITPAPVISSPSTGSSSAPMSSLSRYPPAPSCWAPACWVWWASVSGKIAPNPLNPTEV